MSHLHCLSCCHPSTQIRNTTCVLLMSQLVQALLGSLAVVAVLVVAHLDSCRVPLQASFATTLGLGFLRPAAAASFATSAAVIDQVTFREMGMLSWLIIDFAIQWGGWAVSALLKVGRGPLARATHTCNAPASCPYATVMHQ